MSVFVDSVGLNITLWVWDTTRHIFDIFCIKVSVGVLAVDDLKNPQNEKNIEVNKTVSKVTCVQERNPVSNPDKIFIISAEQLSFFSLTLSDDNGYVYIFAARCHASAIYAMSLYLSVYLCLSEVRILVKQLMSDYTHNATR